MTEPDGTAMRGSVMEAEVADMGITSAATGAEAGRTWWRWVRLGGGIAIIGVLVWRLGTGPFLTGLRDLDGWSLVTTTAIAVVTTVCCAWRWRLVARGLDVGLPLRAAVAACYRSQFLNTTLPGGVLGDVHRGVRHGRDAGSVGRGLRAVAWERTAGQVVQLVIALAALLLLPSPVRSAMPAVAIALLAVALLVTLAVRYRGRAGAVDGGAGPAPSRWARAIGRDVRHGLLARRAWPGIAVASTVVVAGHAATFLIAARVAGVTASPARMLPIALLVLLAMGIPANVGGWGPREGVAAWAFAAAGLGAGAGVATAVVYGVMAMVASLPGVAVLAVQLPRARRFGLARG